MYDIIIIGAGVSGVSCAISLNENLKVLLIDKNLRIGEKLSLTGNGRCNITNMSSNEEFLSNIHNYKFLYSTLSNYNNYDLVNFCYENNVELKEEDHGRMILKSEKSEEIIKVLENKLNNVEVLFNTSVTSVTKNEYFTVNTNKESYTSKSVVVATGGVSYQHTGSTGDGLEIAKSFNHSITPLFASEAPIYINDPITKNLQGVTLSDCQLTVNNKKYRGYNLLITHFGLSGPLAMRNSYTITANKLKTISIDFISSLNGEELKSRLNNEKSIEANLKPYLPKSVVKYLLKDVKNKISFRKLSNKSKEELLNKIKKYEVEISKYPKETEGFVTAGGVNLKEIDNKTFMSKKVDDLYFIGEVLDTHAHTGGYNITIYFSMGKTCAKMLSERFANIE